MCPTWKLTTWRPGSGGCCFQLVFFVWTLTKFSRTYKWISTECVDNTVIYEIKSDSVQCYHKNNRRGAPWKTRHRNQQKHVTAGHVKNEEQTSKYCCNNLKIFALTTQTALRKYIIDNNNSHFCFSFQGKRIYFIWCVLTHEDQKCHTHLWKSCRGLTMSSALFKYIEAKTKQKLPPNGRLCTQHFEISCIKLLIEMSLKFVPSSPINNKPTLFQILAWHRTIIWINDCPVYWCKYASLGLIELVWYTETL